MTQAFERIPSTIQHTQLLAALARLFSQAKIFYQQSAEAAGPGNLRRQFTALAELHQQILYLLPPPCNHTGDDLEALTELNSWYSEKPKHRSLQTIQQQLTKQLQLQKAMIRSCDLGQHQITLLHFTASVQIAADQLLNHNRADAH